jgi:hypothetical protein
MAYEGPHPFPVNSGGTGDSSFIAFAPVCGGITTTDPLQSADTGISTAGFVLTSNGNAALPSFQATGTSSITIDGDTGSITGSTLTFNGLPQAGSTVSFDGSGALMLLNTTDANDNVLIGLNAGNSGVVGAGGGGNCGLGINVLNSLNSGSGNTAMGQFSASSLLDSTGNTAYGSAALSNSSSGDNNTAIGGSSLQGLLTGANNLALGVNSGVNYVASESNNISIGNEGVASESNVIRIGTQGSGVQQQNACFVAGIASVSVTNTQMVTINTSTGQMGSQTIPTGALSWTDNSGTFNAVASHGYFITATSTSTLPASPNEGDTIAFIVDTSSILTITGNTGQKIRVGTSISASAGTCVNHFQGDSIQLVYRTTGATWISIGSPEGTWTIT